MLDNDTLNALHDLMARTIYRAEVAHLPKLSRAEEDELVVRARRGDEEARAALIVSCLASVWYLALRFYLTYQPAHDDALDLAQTASLDMLTALDKALEKSNPGAYLRGIARKAMVVQTTYYSDLIRKPEYPIAKLASLQFPTVESLDAPTKSGSETLKIDLIEMAPPPDKDREERFAPLYEALARLTPRYRNSIAKHFQVGEVDPSVPTHAVGRGELRALRRALNDTYPTAWIKPEQEKEE